VSLFSAGFSLKNPILRRFSGGLEDKPGFDLKPVGYRSLSANSQTFRCDNKLNLYFVMPKIPKFSLCSEQNLLKTSITRPSSVLSPKK
jgi:hypothetical protein